MHVVPAAANARPPLVVTVCSSIRTGINRACPLTAPTPSNTHQHTTTTSIASIEKHSHTQRSKGHPAGSHPEL